MKKFLSLVVSMVIIFGVLGAFGSVIAAGETVETEVWKPTEITLKSSKEYKNPYTDVDIDAVFTHADGTRISTPGFWKEDNTFAVRFTPTKTGEWTYIITCTDAGNSDLNNVQGTVKATENTGNSVFDKHGFVQISADNRHFEYADGTPFFWLGDTNWQAPNYVQTDKCNYPGCKCGNQFKHEVDNRIAKGFTVYQTYFDSAVSDGGGQKELMPSIWAKKFTLPATEIFNKKIDYMFEYLYQNGMVAALGMGVHTNTANNISETDLLRFTRYVVARYSCYSIIWITGQEVTDNRDALATPGKTTLEVYLSVGNTVGKLDGYRHPNGAHMYDVVPSDPRAMKLDSSSWHQTWILQSGHGRKISNKRYYFQYYRNLSGTTKPFIEGEMNYEDIDCGGFNGYDANRYSAWNALFNGCAGFTYGVDGIWANCYSTEKSTGWLGSYSYGPWYMGLDRPGAYEVKYLKQFFEILPDWTKLIPRFLDVTYADFASRQDRFIASTEDMSTVVCYFRDTDTTTGKLMRLDGSKKYNAYWYNVLTGAFIKAGENITPDNGGYTIPERPTNADWVFVLTSESLKDGARFESAYTDLYTDGDSNEITGNIITPAEVKAIGGAQYINNKLVDLKEYLADLSGDKAWEPFASRPTQTIIYDLGVAYNLTHLTIVPQTGTVLPEYRIEVSNDGSTWTIMADATLRGAKMDSENKFVSEKLTGAYRFIKVLLMNPVTIKADQKDTVSYKLDKRVYNSNDAEYYSHTAIAELSVFGSGKANADDASATPVPNTPDDKAPGTADNITEGSKLNVGLLIGVTAAALVVGGGAGVVIAIILKKKKEN